mgnify:CR=1 FL=1
MLLLLAVLAPTLLPDGQSSVLGEVQSAGAVHEMDRTELIAELARRRSAGLRGTESDDELRLRLLAERSRLLERRSAHVMHASKVLEELDRGGAPFLSDLSVDSIMADDNAVFTEALGRRLLEQMKFHASAGAVLTALLWAGEPLGRIRPGLVSWPLGSGSRAMSAGTLCLASSAALCLLQAATRGLRRLIGAPSFFGQRITAVTCREGIIGWVVDVEAARAAAPQAPLPPLLLRRGVAEPVMLLSVGSSVFEEAVFRGLFLHGLHTRARLGPWLAAAVSSAVFGITHMGNEEGGLLGGIYAAWTFVGGLIFGVSYLGTEGGFAVPMLLHFANNAITFAVSARKVAHRLLADQQAYRELAARVARQASAAAQRPAGHPYRTVATGEQLRFRQLRLVDTSGWEVASVGTAGARH